LIGIVVVRGWPGAGELGGAVTAVGPETAALREEQLELARVLSWAVLFAGALQVVVQVPALRRRGLLGGASLAAGSGLALDASAAAWRVLRTAAPLALGAAVYQVNVMIDGYMAQALLPRGGPSAYHYASRLQQFPVAIVATSAIAAVFPSLKALGHTGRRDELRALHDRTQFAVLFLALPACLGLFALARPVCALLFQHGNFGEHGVDRTAATLAALAFAIPAAGAVGLLSRTYYACGDLRTPVRISIGMMGVNLVLNLAFVSGLGMDANGFALSTALTSWINMGLLWPGLVRRLGLPGSGSPWFGRVSRTVAAAAPAAWVARIVQGAVLADAAPNGTRAGVALTAALFAAVVVFLGLARVLRLEELEVVVQRLARRARRRL
jgi:putative peptidoglycan lipid II flippase